MINKIVELGYSEIEAKELIKVSSDIENDYNKLLNKYPIQYLIGYVNFYGYKICVNENVLIPRYETEYLVEKVLKYTKNKFDNPKVLDLCTGSGAIGISIAKNINSVVTESDISKLALEVAKKNAKLNEVDINFVESDLFEKIRDKYNIIVSNPPYVDYNEEVMDSVYKYEPHLALFANDNGLFFYKKILDNIKLHLEDKYFIAFEIGYTQASSIIDYANNIFNSVDIWSEKDLSGKDRYVFITNLTK